MLRIDLARDQVARILWERHRQGGSPNLLRAVAREQDPAAERWEHFQAWFELAVGRQVAVAYPGVAASVMMNLYAPGFAAHETAGYCQVEWWQVHEGFGQQDIVYGQFVCHHNGLGEG